MMPNSLQGKTYRGPSVQHGGTSFEDSGLPESYRSAWDSYPEFNYKKGILDSLGGFVGARTGYDKAYEQWLHERQAYQSQLINQYREEQYNSPEASSARERIAGLNPDISGTTSGTNEASEGTEVPSDFSSRSGDELSEIASTAMSTVSTVFGLMNSIENFKGAKLGNLAKDAELSKMIFEYGRSRATQMFNFRKHSGEHVGRTKDGSLAWLDDETGELKSLINFDDVPWEDYPLATEYSAFRNSLGRKFRSDFDSGVASYFTGLPSMVERLEQGNRAIEAGSKRIGYDTLGITQEQGIDVINDIMDANLRLTKLQQDLSELELKYQKSFTENLDPEQAASSQNAQNSLLETDANAQVSAGVPQAEAGARASEAGNRKSIAEFEKRYNDILNELQNKAKFAPPLVKSVYVQSITDFINFKQSIFSGLGLFGK